MNNVRAVQKLNELELKLGIDASWHDEFKHSAYIAVTGLPFDLTEGDVRVVFSQYGKVVDINLIRDKTTGKSRGFGFLAYEDQRSTVLAVDNFNGAQLLGRTLRVDHCKDYKPPKKKDEKDEKDKEGAKGADAPGPWQHDRHGGPHQGGDELRAPRRGDAMEPTDARGTRDAERPPRGGDREESDRGRDRRDRDDRDYRSSRDRDSRDYDRDRSRDRDLSPPRRSSAPSTSRGGGVSGGVSGSADISPPRRRVTSPSPRAPRGTELSPPRRVRDVEALRSTHPPKRSSPPRSHSQHSQPQSQQAGSADLSPPRKRRSPSPRRRSPDRKRRSPSPRSSHHSPPRR